MKLIRLLLILIIVIIAVWQLTPHFKDFTEIYRLKDKINFGWLLLAIASQFGQYVGDGWLSKTLLKIAGTNISFKNTLRIASMNVFAAHLLPIGQAGALATAFYFYRKLGVTNQKFIFLSLCWTAITGFALASIFIFSLLSLPDIPDIGYSYRKIAAVILMLGIIIVILGQINDKIIWPRLRPLVTKNIIYKEFLEFKKNFPIYKEAIVKNRFLFAQALIAAFIYYISNVATLSTSFLTFGVEPSISLMAFVYVVSLIAGWITLAPAGIGATEATMLLIFLQFKINPAEAVAATLLFRLISFWIPIPTGALAYFSLQRHTKKK